MDASSSTAFAASAGAAAAVLVVTVYVLIWRASNTFNIELNISTSTGRVTVGASRRALAAHLHEGDGQRLTIYRPVFAAGNNARPAKPYARDDDLGELDDFMDACIDSGTTGFLIAELKAPGACRGTPRARVCAAARVCVGHAAASKARG